VVFFICFGGGGGVISRGGGVGGYWWKINWGEKGEGDDGRGWIMADGALMRR